MASLDLEFASFADGQVRLDLTISTANWRVSQIRCVNNSQYAAVGYAYKAGQLVFTAVAPPGETTSWNTSGIQLGWQPDYWNDLTQQWEPGGIEMGDYTLTAQWPGEV